MTGESSYRIAVIGAGLMGHGIAQEFAQGGFKVSLYDSDATRRERVLDQIETNLHLIAENHVITPDDVPLTLSRIRVMDELETAIRDTNFVIEAVFENLKLKKSIFRRLDDICPEDTILTSNSSSFTPSQYAQDVRLPGRIIGTHYFNPPYLVPLVEVIKGKGTSGKTLEATVKLLRKIGKKVAIVKKEIPGFIANRIQIALFREAFNVVEQGIATPEEVDLAIKSSFGRRLGIMGPFEQCDIIGADLKLAIYEALVPNISNSRAPTPLLTKNVRENNLGMKTGRGFYTWTPHSAQVKNREIRQWLIEMNRLEALLDRPSVEEGKPEDKGEKG